MSKLHSIEILTYLLANSNNSLAYKCAYSIEILAYQYMFAIFLDTSCVCVIQEPKRWLFFSGSNVKDFVFPFVGLKFFSMVC